jgi:hypothetical protein
MKVIVCGSPQFKYAAFVRRELDRLHEELGFTDLLQSGEPGVAKFARDWAATRPEIRRFVCRALYEKHGAAAGARRNAKMMNWKPDLVIAFPGNAVTADLVRQATAAGVPVRRLSWSEDSAPHD